MKSVIVSTYCPSICHEVMGLDTIILFSFLNGQILQRLGSSLTHVCIPPAASFSTTANVVANSFLRNGYVFFFIYEFSVGHIYFSSVSVFYPALR